MAQGVADMDSFVIMNKLKVLLAVELPSEHRNELQASKKKNCIKST
jgi:hypothetical protein